MKKSELQALEVRGRDSRSFLNGMLTADIAKLPANGASPFCAVDRRGKMISFGFAISAPPSFFLIVDNQDALSGHLSRFIIREDVSIQKSDYCVYETVEGKSPVGCLKTHIEASGTILAGISRAYAHGAMILSKEALPEKNAEMFEQKRVMFGFPIRGREIDADTIPPELHLENVAVSYTKGCYLGQEVIQRIKTYGEPAERMYLVSGGQTVGRIASTAVVEGVQYSICFLQKGESARGADVPPFAKFYRSLFGFGHEECGGKLEPAVYGMPSCAPGCGHYHAGCAVDVHVTHGCKKCGKEFELP